MTQDQLLAEIQQLKARNARVEADKAREISWIRRGLITGLTYMVICLVFVQFGSSHRYLDALVPTLGFILSTLSFDWIKKRWVKRF